MCLRDLCQNHNAIKHCVCGRQAIRNDIWKTHQLEKYSGDSVSATELALNTSQSQLFSSTTKGVLTFQHIQVKMYFELSPSKISIYILCLILWELHFQNEAEMSREKKKKGRKCRNK